MKIPQIVAALQTVNVFLSEKKSLTGEEIFADLYKTHPQPWRIVHIHGDGIHQLMSAYDHLIIGGAKKVVEEYLRVGTDVTDYCEKEIPEYYLTIKANWDLNYQNGKVMIFPVLEKEGKSY